MFIYFSKPKRNPCYINYDSFILCRPGKSYKVNANVSILNAEEPILYDVGMDRNMLYLIEKALYSIRRKPTDLRKIIISHSHPDHCVNLLYFRLFFPNCKIIWHKSAYQNLVNAFQYSTESVKPYKKRLFKYSTKIMQLWEASIITRMNKNYVCEDNALISCRDRKLRVIHTPGHSLGHICLHDITNKVLFLGDHVPLTPWLDISSNSIDNMISSIRKLLKLSSKEVEYSVRGHGNIGDNSQEVYPWEEEKARFEEHLNLILRSIDNILYVLKRKELTVEEIANYILKNKDFRKYSSFMNFIFMPPNLTWVLSYILKLRKEKKIRQIGIRWTAT